MKNSLERNKQIINFLCYRYHSKPDEALEYGEKALADQDDQKFIASVLSVMSKAVKNVLHHLDEEGLGSFSDKPRSYFEDFKLKIDARINQLELINIKSSRAEKNEALIQQVYVAPDLEEFAEAFGAKITSKEERLIVERASGEELIQALEEVASNFLTPGYEILEILSIKSYETLMLSRLQKPAGWEKKFEALTDSFEKVSLKHGLPLFFGELALSEIVSFFLITKNQSLWERIKALVPIVPLHPSLAFRLARSYALLGEKQKMLKYLRRAATLERTCFEPDDVEFEPYFEDEEFKKFLEDYP